MDNVIFDKKNVLVIGGAGFIGSHLCDELIKTSKVICLDNFSTGDEKNIDHLLSEPDFEFIKHDIIDPVDLEKQPELQKFKIQFQGIQEIYNLACPFSPNNFDALRIPMILANSLGVKNVLDIALKYKTKLLHFSSAAVYGEFKERTMVSEDYIGNLDYLSAQSAYYEGRRFAESLVVNYKKHYNIDAKIIRLFNIYGPRMSLFDGQLIPSIITGALNGNDIVINAEESSLSSFCYVDDVVDAALKIINTSKSELYNIGSDVDLKILDLANMIVNACESKSTIKLSDNKIIELTMPIPDISRSRNDLGWMPIVTVEKGLERTIYEFRARIGLKGVSFIKK